MIKMDGLKGHLNNEMGKLENTFNYLGFIAAHFDTQFDGSAEDKQAIYKASEAVREAYEILLALLSEDSPRLGCISVQPADIDNVAKRKLYEEGEFKPEGLTEEGSRVFAIGLVNSAMDDVQKGLVKGEFKIRRDASGYYYAVAIKQKDKG